jgi:chromosome segregation ATPase
MDDRVSEQLDKILALADSNHEGEAVVAVRKAREMLSRDGLSFGDLARAASTHTYARSSGAFSFLSGGREFMESKINHLRQQVEDLQAQLQTQDFQLDFWRRRVTELEQSYQHAHSEAERWKKLASETANRLWDIARSVSGESFQAEGAAEEEDHSVAEKK